MARLVVRATYRGRVLVVVARTKPGHDGRGASGPFPASLNLL
jgi:hypothetical protein